MPESKGGDLEAVTKERDELRAKVERHERAFRCLLDSDGHAKKCSFIGCNCGSVEQYKAARSEAIKLVRPSPNSGTTL